MDRHLPAPFAWCKAFHTGDNSSIYQVLLCRVFGIRHKLDERQNCVNPLQGFNELTFVVIVDGTPCDSRCTVANDSLLSCVSNTLLRTKLSRLQYIPAQNYYFMFF